jgi:hypothetical protein
LLREAARATEGDDHLPPQVPLEQLNLGDLEGQTEASSCPRFLARLVEVSVSGSLRKRFAVSQTKPPRIGTFWCGRPAIFIVAFENQGPSSQQIHAHFHEQIASIMSGNTGLPASTRWEQITGPNLRMFDDYAVFLNRSVTLWVCSTRVTESITDRRNWAQAIYDKQVQSEMIDYLYASHRQMEERSVEGRTTVEHFVAEEMRLANLQRLVADGSHFGEIGNLLAYADEVLCSGVRRRTEENLRRQALVAAERRDLRARRFGWLLTILLSTTGISSLASSAVLPMWKWSGWPLPSDPNAAAVAALAISSIVMTLAVTLMWRRLGLRE